MVDTRVIVGCCHAKTVLSIVSAASLLVRLVGKVRPPLAPDNMIRFAATSVTGHRRVG